MSIFKAYDIRGVYPKELNEEIIYKIAKAFAAFTGAKKIVVGGDNRLSTLSLKNNFIKGLLDSGVDVTDIGTVPTSMVYFACYKLGYESGAMITASHNPKDFNGIKLCGSDGLAIGMENGLKEIKEIMEKSAFKEGQGRLNALNIFEDYAEFVKDFTMNNFRGLKVVIDGSNGSAGIIYGRSLRMLGADVVDIFCTPDGNFPNHKIPDPLIEENLKEIKEQVKSSNADIGFALDGDGDRLVVIDENGEKINTSHVAALLTERCLSENKNAKIVYDILSSQLVEEVIKQNGGTPVVWKVGHSNIPLKCKEIDAHLAVEVSSHYYFKESNYTDDTLVAAIKILDILASARKKPSELTRKYPKYYQVLEKRIPIPEEMKFSFIESLKEDFLRRGYEISTLDGVKVKFKNGWAVFRASNTESKIAISYESPNLGEFEELERIVNHVIERIPANLNNIKVIIFDLQDVLTTDWRNVFNLLDSNIKPDAIAEFFDDHNDLRKELQYGRLSEDEFWREFIHLTRANIAIDQLKVAVRNVLKPFPNVIDIAKSLKRNYKLVILSNFTKEWAEYLILQYNFNEIFDHMFWSFQNGIKKPSAEAYAQVIEKFKVKPEDCLFIDDKERNIKGAKEVGMETIQYTNPENLKKELSEAGIKIGG